MSFGRYVLSVGIAAALASAGRFTSIDAAQKPDGAGQRAAAQVGEMTITLDQIEDKWRQKDPAGFYRFDRQRYEMWVRVLDEMIAEELIGREARRRGITVEQLVQRETDARKQPITDEDIRGEYEQTKGRGSTLSVEQLRPLIVNYLSQKRAADARTHYVTELRAANDTSIKVHLAPQRQNVAIGRNDPSFGPDKAPVTIVVFSDFECPYCRQIEPALSRLRDKYPDQVRMVWKDFPLPIHQNGRPAARAARCAGEQGMFAPYRDKLFQHQPQFAAADLVRYATELRLDRDLFERCVRSNRFDVEIEASVKEGMSLGVASTPSLFFNGRPVAGAVPFEALDRIVAEELRHATVTGTSGAIER